MRNFAILALVILLGGGLLKAQIFNLEDEDSSEMERAPAQQRGAKRPPKPIIAPAAELPEDESDKVALDKIYGDITAALKANDVEKATKIMSLHDVITKQKIVHRLLQENPRDFEQRPVTNDAAFGDVPVGTPAVQDLNSNEE